MRTTGLAAAMILAAMLASGQAAAQTPDGSVQVTAPAPPLPLCTTTTVVVKRGDLVVSSSSTTKCEDEGSSGGVNPKAVLGAPAGAVSMLGRMLASGDGEKATAQSVRGDWHVLDSRADRVCHLFLTVQPDPAGFRVRRTDCRGELAQAQAWTFEDGGVALHGKGGGVLMRLQGDREQLQGVDSSGGPVVLVH